MCLNVMSVFGGSVFGRHAPTRVEYKLYAKVCDTPSPFNESVQPLTDSDLIDQSDCMYQSIWKDTVQPHFKSGLLFCRNGVNIERGQWNRQDNITNRTIFLIPCEVGLTHFEERNKEWYKQDENIIPANYIYLRWNIDHLFTTADGKSIQLKIIDEHPDAAQQRSAFKRGNGNGNAQLAQMHALLRQMKLSDNK